MVYRIGPQMTRLMWTYWERLTILARTGRYYGDLLTGKIGVKQGDPLSPTILNMVVDAVIRHWAKVVVGEAEGPEVFWREV